VLASLARAYDAEDAINGWIGHYPGGPVGFAQRELKIAPGQTGSRWHREPVAYGHALARNPSLPGGAKCEDTCLVAAGGLSRVTRAPGWPTEVNDDWRRERPAPLEVGT